uniref:DUF3025 domain-containing protein n=1 Tax=Rheinheimera sp. TaxID=1869214 RepID=UPI004047B8A3
MQKTAVKNRFTPPLDWDASLLHRSPIFADLCQRFSLEPLSQWPDVAWLNQCVTHATVRFVDNDALAADGRYYEEYIYATRCVPTRKDNWHDFFGALIWCLFPKSKALLNQLHMAEIAEHGQQQRSKLRNKLTLLDECGVLVCLEPEQLAHAELLRNHQWQQSFVTKRSDWWQGVRPVIFGHAIYEMATAPFLGLTAKCLFIDVPEGFSQWHLTEVYHYLDGQLCSLIRQDALLSTEQLTPLPLLGVPEWFAANENPQFYLNHDYFRPRRR